MTFSSWPNTPIVTLKVKVKTTLYYAAYKTELKYLRTLHPPPPQKKKARKKVR